MPTVSDLDRLIQSRLDDLEAEHRLRRIPDEVTDGCIDLCSNDYLGLGHRAGEWREEFLNRFPDAAFTSSASRLLSRRQRHHLMLEARLSELYGREALLFNSGYHANVGCIGALSLPSTLFVADRLIHASAIDGLRTIGAEFTRFRHNDIGHLERIIATKGKDYRQIIVLVESVYSMDGDTAPLDELVRLRRRDPRVILYVDEAHGVGCFGERGLGLAEEMGVADQIDIIIGTAGKALASAGAYAITSPTLKNWLINSARSFIFSTALPPACCAWTQLMLEKSGGMQSERQHLREISRRFAEGLGSHWGGSQIIPLITHDALKAVELATTLASHGVDALPIRRPTVPPGEERIRFSLNALLSMDDLTHVIELCKL